MLESGIGVVLLAAGRGTRFGPEPKLLERLDGKPLVRHAAEAAFGSGLRPIVVVLGANAAPVQAALADLDPAEARELVVDAWRMVVPQKVTRAWDDAHPDGPG